MRAVAVLRVVSALEGLSYLLLVFVAMPLKYGFGWPLGVRVSGMGHGWLFIAFVAAGLIAYHRVQEREPEPPPGPTSEASRDVVEVEIVAE